MDFIKERLTLLDGEIKEVGKEMKDLYGILDINKDTRRWQDLKPALRNFRPKKGNSYLGEIRCPTSY